MKLIPKLPRFKTIAFYALIIGLYVLLLSFADRLAIDSTDREVIGNTLEWFGVPYGVLLALVVVEAWRWNNLVTNEIDREADALVSMLKTARYIHNRKFLSTIARKLRDYAQAVLDSGNQNENRITRITGLLDDIHREVGTFIAGPSGSTILKGEMLRYVNEALDIRGDRLAHLEEKMHPALWFLLLFTSIAWTIGFFSLELNSKIVLVIISGVVMFTVFTIIYVVWDLRFSAKDYMKTKRNSFQVLSDEAQNILNTLTS
ncbi:MAG: DUF4239 domain-containing protein [Methanobacteriota archaeon]|nr:MAG: DUF4239 domain-containing protein [Euryarchaeota archaeon]